MKRFARTASLAAITLIFAAMCKLGFPTVSAEPFVIGFERFARHGELSQIDAGGLLVNELNCTACHEADHAWLSAKGAPNLSGVGLRLQADWLRRYLADPSAIDPGTTMPDVMQSLNPAEKQDAIESLVAFLSTQQMPFATLKAGGALPVVHEFWNRGDPMRGRRLYHTVGCVACHQADENYEVPDTTPSAIDELIEQLDPEQLEEMGLAGVARRVESIPHGDLDSKYTRRSLTMMLLDPALTRPSDRMPNLRLAPDEAADLAAYLLDGQAPSPQPTPRDPNPSRIQQGKVWFNRLGCANCHATMNGPPTAEVRSRPLSELSLDASSSCLNDPTGAMPRYALDAAQQQAIGQRLTQRHDPSDMKPSVLVRNRMIQLNCVGCHARAASADEQEIGGVGRFRKAYFETVGQVDLGDEGRLPPPLTGIGKKLTSSALSAVFSAKTPPHRSYMTIRMPAYHGDTIAQWLKQIPLADEVDRRDFKQVFTQAAADTESLLQAGRALANTGCVQCHQFAGEALPGVVGIDLQGITKRVHPAWFQSFVFNPTDVKRRTRMPTFFPDGRSNSPRLLDGHVDQQIAALWLYLDRLDQQPLPEQIAIARSANYELIPTERPLILRTFMDRVGTSAIAVGMPNGVHYAWDCETCRPVLGWKGRFLDARGTWFERFSPPAQPLGEQVVQLTAAAEYLLMDEPLTQEGREVLVPSFQGYRINSQGTPTMMIQVGDWKVDDRLEATEDGTLLREIKVIAAPTDKRQVAAEAIKNDQPAHHRNLMWLAQSGEMIERVGPMAFRNSDGLTVTVSVVDGSSHLGSLERTELGSRWLIELNPPQTLRVEYRW